MRTTSALLAILILGVATPAMAAPCKDAKGKFIKCPPPKSGPCKSSSGKFVKCGTPGAMPLRK